MGETKVKMNCPKDGSLMEALLFDGHELDCCPKCSGIWMDWGELRKVAGNRANEHELNYRGESKRVCPRCGKMMRKADLHSVIVEECRCGIFFDRGEAEKVLGIKLESQNESITLTKKQLQELIENGAIEISGVRIKVID